jgi:hypothetical protein
MRYDNELNERIGKRQYPTTALRPVFDIRPVPTKYVHFQLFEERKKPTVPLNNYSTYDPTTTFTPSDRPGPVEYFFNNIDTETKIRNQSMALQKCDRAVYVPESASDLYQPQTFLTKTELQKETTIQNIHFNPDRCNLAPNAFFNHTRNNLKNL